MVSSSKSSLRPNGKNSTSSTTDLNSTYLKAAQVYDDGSIKAKYFAEAIREDEGISPPGHYD